MAKITEAKLKDMGFIRVGTKSKYYSNPYTFKSDVVDILLGKQIGQYNNNWYIIKYRTDATWEKEMQISTIEDIIKFLLEIAIERGMKLRSDQITNLLRGE